MADSSAAPVRRITRPRLIVRLHRWISLAFAAFWLIQAATGVLIVFHWEAEDATVAGAHRPTDLAAIDARIAALAPPGSGRKVDAMWTTAGAADRYDIFLSDAARGGQSVRIAGDGTILRQQGSGDTGLVGILVAIHQNLLGGDLGEWIVGISGIVLLTNLALALVVAWPTRGQWRRSLKPATRGAPVARYFGWHRAIGLWAVLPALCLIAAGTLLRFEHGTSELIGARGAAPPPPLVSALPHIPLSRAVAAAQRSLPGSRLTAVTMPMAEDATYEIRLLAPGEIRRAYGTSLIHVDATTGAIRAVAPAAAASPAKAFMDALYAVHTGELGGPVGRLLVLALGLWLIAMIVIGLLLWNRRRPRT